MKPIVWKFGLISGAILAGMMVATIPFMENIGYDMGMVVGYTTMVVAFLFVFFGIRTYRDEVGGGVVSFGRAFQVGILIVAIASLCYVLTWEILYYNVMGPEFGDKMTASMMEKAAKSGASPEVLAEKRAEMDKMMELYKNPLINSAMTLLEVFPIGLIVAAISAAILRRRTADGMPQIA